MNLIFNYYAEIKSELKCKFSTILKANQKFCLTLDEWTSSRNRRYMNINVMCNDGIFENLGLIRIEGSCGAEKTLDLVNERLKEFNLNLSTDITAIITDGAAVMGKFGKLAPAFHLQCYTHGIYLAVLDTLFGSTKTELLLRKDQQHQVDQLLDSDDDSDIEGIENNDDGLDKDENPAFEGMSYEHDTNISYLKFKELKPQIQDAMKQIRKIASFFRKSPVRNTILQQNVKLECGKELNLSLDCTTRWNSLLDMLERFEKIRIPIKKSLCEINATHLLEKEDQLFQIVRALITCLRPVKLASEALCRRDMDLIKSEGILSFLIETLNALDNSISRELLQNFKLRMITRRPKILISLIKYLNNSSLLYSKQNDNFFEMSSKSEMIKLSKELLHRLFPVNIIEDTVVLENEDSVLISDTENNIEAEIPANVLKRKLESAINMSTKKQNTGDTEYKTILKEFNLYEASGKLTKNLKMLLDALLCIKPTSVESERVFSTAGLFVTKIRTRLNDNSVNALVCLRTHFINSSNK
jgi:hypothetical protein